METIIRKDSEIKGKHSLFFVEFMEMRKLEYMR